MKLSPLALTASLVLGLGALVPAVASAQTAAPQAAPQFTPPQLAAAQTSGTLAHYIVGPMGRVQGFVLDNGAVVLVHGRGGQALASSVPVGQSVRVDGLAAPSNPTQIFRATVYGPNGAVLLAPHQGRFGAGPQGMQQGAQPGMQPGAQQGFAGHRWGQRMHDPARRAAMLARLEQLPTRTASGTVQAVLTGFRGHARGAVLTDGTTVLFGHPMARAVSQHGVRVGENLRVVGRGNAYPQGASVLAEQVTFADGASVNAPLAAAQPAQ